MKCRTAIDGMLLSLDGQLDAAGREQLRAHMAQCSECALHGHQLERMMGGLRNLPERSVPPDLNMALRVRASRARQERVRTATVKASVEYWLDLTRLWMDNLMRPLALPFAGGLLTAVFLFMMMAPMYMNHGSHAVADVPTKITQPATLKSALYSYGQIDRAIVIDVWIDGNGRLIDYSIPLGQTWARNADFRRSVENALLCTQFNPAKMFGMPKSGKLRITVSRSEVEVSG